MTIALAKGSVGTRPFSILVFSISAYKIEGTDYKAGMNHKYGQTVRVGSSTSKVPRPRLFSVDREMT